MIYMWFTGINYSKLAVEKDRDSIFTTIRTTWKACLTVSEATVTLSASNPCMNKYDWLNVLLLHTATRYCFLVGIVRLEAR